MSDYYKTQASVAEYIQMAKDVNGGALIKKLQMHLPAPASILEIGSGPGTDWNLLTAHYEVTGSDNSPEFLKYLQTNYAKGQFLELDAVTLETTEKFDGLYSNKVLHHLRDEELKTSIIRQKAILNPDGIICHSFWKGEGSEMFKGMLVNYHDHTSLLDFFGKDFELLLTEPYAEFEPEDSILMIAKRK
ncbi:MAG: class I SAM-dependent methyltransferase [Cytophagales bacterium]|nr:class I SAM-dependent methyltransferase [Cytophagales bacterium]